VFWLCGFDKNWEWRWQGVNSNEFRKRLRNIDARKLRKTLEDLQLELLKVRAKKDCLGGLKKGEGSVVRTKRYIAIVKTIARERGIKLEGGGV